MGSSEAALRAAYSAASIWNDWATGAVTVGVVIELVALLLFSKEVPRNEKIALLIGSILVVVGVSGEWVFGGRASSAAAQLQQASEEKIAKLERDEETDHRIAQIAAAHAADLGVTVSKLPTFVNAQIALVRRQYEILKIGVDATSKRDTAIIEQFRRDKESFDKARIDALAAASEGEKALAAMRDQLDAEEVLRAKIERLTARRILTDQQIAEMVTSLSALPVKYLFIWPLSANDDVMQLSLRLSEVAAGVKKEHARDEVQEMGPQYDPRFPAGVTVQYTRGNEWGKNFATEWVKLLNADHIAAQTSEIVITNPQYDPTKPDQASIWVWVGQIP